MGRRRISRSIFQSGCYVPIRDKRLNELKGDCEAFGLDFVVFLEKATSWKSSCELPGGNQASDLKSHARQKTLGELAEDGEAPRNPSSNTAQAET